MEKKPRGAKFQGGTTTRVVYVGTDGYGELVKSAINISHQGGKQISPSELARYLIFNIPESTISSLIEQMKSQPDQ